MELPPPANCEPPTRERGVVSVPNLCQPVFWFIELREKVLAAPRLKLRPEENPEELPRAKELALERAPEPANERQLPAELDMPREP